MNRSLNELWLKRWNQDIPAAREGLRLWCENQGFASLTAGDLRSIETAHFANYRDAVLLEASLLRAGGHRRQSSSLIAKTLHICRERDQDPGYTLYFELGLDHWISEELPQAVDCFLKASELAETPVQRLFTKGNLLWCLAHLDLPRESLELEVENELAAAANLDSKLIKHVREQFLGYRFRGSFHRGENLQQFIFLSDEFFGQASYLYIWVMSLPFLHSTTKIPKFLREGYLWQGSYRLATLKGEVAKEHVSHTRMDDVIDRLYLWVWRWLCDSRDEDLQKVILTLESLLVHLDFSTLSKNSKVVLRSALAWIRLLTPKYLRRFEKLFERLTRLETHGRHGFFDAEFRWTVNFQTSPAPHPYFSRLMQELQDPSSTKWANLRARLFERDHENQLSDLVVDLSRGEIEAVVSGQRVRSPLLCDLLLALKNKPSVTAEELWTTPDPDPRRLYNLVARAKRLIPDLKVVVRENRIYRESPLLGVSYTGVHTPGGAQLDSDPSMGPKVESNFLGLARVMFTAEFERRDLERAFRISKVTAWRLISQWQSLGAIQRIERGRSTKYVWS